MTTENPIESSRFSLQDYLDRIAFKGELNPTIECVRKMMLCQLFTVPFENLDVQAGKIVSMNPDDIVEKIVYGNRGGYCYEVNGLFAMALQAMGIRTIFAAARPMFYPMRRPKTHMVLVATIGGEDYLMDLGFGSHGLREPICLNQLDCEVQQGPDTYKLTKINDREYLLLAKVNDVWANQFSFEPQHQEWIDFAPVNYLNSTHPEAIFVQKPLIILYNEKGRTILLGDTLKVMENGVATTSTFAPEEYDALLWSCFKLKRG